MRLSIIFLFSLLFFSCEDETVVKPNAMLRLSYDDGVYKNIETDCPYTFSKNSLASATQIKNCGFNIHYPKMKATLYINYQKVNDTNLNFLIYDAQKLAYGHNIKAKSIPEQPYVNPANNSYGMLYMINGDAASQSQFYITDSINHFVTGALYFEAKPNFDSIYPAVVYLRDDIRMIMETMTWKN